MGPEEIKEKFAKRPFQPLRIYVSDGATYDVRHPEMVLITRRELHVGIPSKPDDQIPDRTAFVNILHVTHIEPINGKKPPRRRSA